MFTDSMSTSSGSSPSRWAATHSSAQTIHDSQLVPCSGNTRSAHSRAPGATPTTPMPLSLAAAMPATCVPCPLTSSQSPRSEVTQLYPPATFRSGWLRWMPVSMIAMSASTRVSVPSMSAIDDSSASTRPTPGGRIWSVSSKARSGRTEATRGSRCSSPTWRAVRVAEKPLATRS